MNASRRPDARQRSTTALKTSVPAASSAADATKTAASGVSSANGCAQARRAQGLPAPPQVGALGGRVRQREAQREADDEPKEDCRRDERKVLLVLGAKERPQPGHASACSGGMYAIPGASATGQH